MRPTPRTVLRAASVVVVASLGFVAAGCGSPDAGDTGVDRDRSSTTIAADDATAIPDAGTVAVAGGYTVVFTDPSLARVPSALAAQAEQVQAATIVSPDKKPVAAFVLVTPKVGTVLTDHIVAQMLATQFGAVPQQVSVAGKPALAARSGDGIVVIARVNEDGVLAMFVGYPGVDQASVVAAVEAVTAVPEPPA